MVDKISYLLDTKRAISFVSKFKSYFDAKGTMIGVVSKSLLREKSTGKVSSEKFEKKKVDPQLKLFK